jgi:hypothetical protein
VLPSLSPLPLISIGKFAQPAGPLSPVVRVGCWDLLPCCLPRALADGSCTELMIHVPFPAQEDKSRGSQVPGKDPPISFPTRRHHLPTPILDSHDSKTTLSALSLALDPRTTPRRSAVCRITTTSLLPLSRKRKADPRGPDSNQCRPLSRNAARSTRS